jgi:phosphofructokinase-like protein
MKRIGVLTGGGDCPGLNAVIRAVVRRASDTYNIEVLGIREGWAGLVNGNVEPLTHFSVSGILPRGGTILGTSRTNPFKSNESIQKVINNIKRYGIDGLIAVGGEDTLGVAHRFHAMGIPVVGVPKTIDNDLPGTDYTFGFDTAVSIVTDAIDRLHTTAESHHRVMVIEVMGRHTGWIATMSGIAGGADCILIPEKPFKICEVAEMIKKRRERGKTFSIIVVAEGVKLDESDGFVVQDEKRDEFGHARLGGVGSIIGRKIEELTGMETRVTTLGYIQRGGSPTAFDRILATRFGVKAVDMLVNKEHGKMACLKGNNIDSVDLQEITSGSKTITADLYQIAELFFG